MERGGRDRLGAGISRFSLTRSRKVLKFKQLDFPWNLFLKEQVMLRFAEAMKRLGTETAFETLARAKELEAQGRDIVHLEIGEPDFVTPRNIIERAKKALDEGDTHYGPPSGTAACRQAVAEYIAKDRGIDAKPENVIMTPGGKPVMFYTMLAVLDPGDEVIHPNPGYPIYESVIKYLGAKAVPITPKQELDFRLDLDELRSKLSSKTKLLVLNSPHNPTGGVLADEDLDGIADMLQDYPDVWVLSDEIYSRLLYEGTHSSIATRPGMFERTVLLDGFSKTYAMTGWRLGYGVMPVPLAQKVAQLATNCNSCVPGFVQQAGIEALQGPQDEVEAMRLSFQKRRDHLVDGLNRIEGFECLRPKGAFYVFPDVRSFGRPAKEMATELLNDFGVACLSGTAFGEFGEGHLRFSCANSVENIDKGLERIASFVGAARKV